MLKIKKKKKKKKNAKDLGKFCIDHWVVEIDGTSVLFLLLCWSVPLIIPRTDNDPIRDTHKCLLVTIP